MKHDGPALYYKRKIFEAENPTYAGSFAVDFVVPPFQDHDSSLPPRSAHFTDVDSERIGSLDTKVLANYQSLEILETLQRQWSINAEKL